MKQLLISACLMGVNCRYAGNGQKIEGLEKILKKYHPIPVCPEQMGGLPTPRKPAERLNDRIINCDGEDVTDAFERGAREVLKLAEICEAHCALLKERSPSCGCGEIYDGSFTGKRIEGDGVTAALLKQKGIIVLGESRIDELIENQ